MDLTIREAAHLQLLALVALALRDAELCRGLVERAPQDVIFQRLDDVLAPVENRRR